MVCAVILHLALSAIAPVAAPLQRWQRYHAPDTGSTTGRNDRESERWMARASRRAWNLDEAMAALDAVRDEQIATIFARRNPGMVVWGIRYGDLEKIAKQITPNAELAAALWDTGVFEARTLALRVLPNGALTEAQIDAWVSDLNFPTLSDEFAGAVFHTPWARSKMDAWIEDERDFVKRAGYALLYGFAAEPDSGISREEWLAWLKRIEREIHQSPNWSREMMNLLPIAIGLRDTALYEPALAAARAYGKIDVFHGDKTNCKIQDPVALLQDPRTKIKRY
jgi:hypothetical protein